MTTLQKGILLGAGSLALTFVLSIGLGWYAFGYLDYGTIRQMLLMLLPPLVVAVAVVSVAGKHQEDLPQARPQVRQGAGRIHEPAVMRTGAL